MTAVHRVSLTECHDQSGAVYWHSTCQTCGLWNAIHISRMTIADWGAQHLAVVRDLAQQGFTITGEAP